MMPSSSYNSIMTQFETDVLQAALVGLQQESSRIDAKIAEIRARIGGSHRSVTPDGNRAARKRTLSAAARRRIAAAQRKRWATYQTESHATEPLEKQKVAKAKKRNLSAAGKKRIAEATKKRWAAFRAAKARKTRTAA
jgi:hypothetical protein